ncbi:MAG: DUF4276 family protein [Alphaproteobacteria bacterium]|nr:DUF4276 family protein [Alphaproteobacteria bacterium]
MRYDLVFFLEEPSAKELLKGLLPNIINPALSVQYVIFDGKQDLDKHLGRKLRAWLPPRPRFIVLRDQDGADCRILKRKLVEICTSSGQPDTLVRIACHELESWFLGDLAAVEIALNLKKLARQQTHQKFRTPDTLANAAEELSKITGGQYQKIAGSRDIGPHLQPDRNRSVRAF